MRKGRTTRWLNKPAAFFSSSDAFSAVASLCLLLIALCARIPVRSLSPAKKPARSRYQVCMPAVRCKSCKIVCRGNFYRCATCTSPTLDLCRRCFAAPGNSIHHDVRHIFVTADASSYPAVWKAAVPPVDRSRVFSGLQSRDLSDRDYHLLLSLDADNVPPVHRHLVQALEKVDISEVLRTDTCKICTSFLSVDPALRRLPCSQKVRLRKSNSAAVAFFFLNINIYPGICCNLCHRFLSHYRSACNQYHFVRRHQFFFHLSSALCTSRAPSLFS